MSIFHDFRRFYNVFDLVFLSSYYPLSHTLRLHQEEEIKICFIVEFFKNIKNKILFLIEFLEKYMMMKNNIHFLLCLVKKIVVYFFIFCSIFSISWSNMCFILVLDVNEKSMYTESERYVSLAWLFFSLFFFVFMVTVLIFITHIFSLRSFITVFSYPPAHKPTRPARAQTSWTQARVARAQPRPVLGIAHGRAGLANKPAPGPSQADGSARPIGPFFWFLFFIFNSAHTIWPWGWECDQGQSQIFY